jgi:hypothetical protein
LFPGVLVLFLLLTRRFRGVVAAGLAYLSVAAVMTSGYGWQAWKDFFHQQGPIANYWIGHVRNASLHGVIVRLFRPLCERPADDAHVLDIVGALRKLPSLPPIPGARWAALLSLVLVAACWWISRHDARRAATVDVPYALFSTVAVFVNPWIWEHYDVLLIMPICVLISGLGQSATKLRKLLLEPTKSLRAAWPVAAAQFAFLAAAVMASLVLLSVNSYTKSSLYDQYWALRNAGQHVPADLHVRMHAYEVLNWLPWVVAIVGIAGLVLFERGSHRRLSIAPEPLRVGGRLKRT